MSPLQPHYPWSVKLRAECGTEAANQPTSQPASQRAIEPASHSPFAATVGRRITSRPHGPCKLPRQVV
ncbi:hypothetical protein E2C01_093789 [Portunus trituberculatus]|uniref:Uncharacterized protein n=1 Tax=Portunus trituberculatus TaxID=210409 RepID=A0A5B7JZN9_PORTR|nr:hypothetical protein [Portunus trituberculatus]